MFGILLYDILFFGIPVILIALLGVCLYRYISAKRQNEASPGKFSDKEIRKRKIMLILVSVIVGILTAIVIGFIALLYMAVAYM
jgi:multisubunit Na+/H+ antiporter MnhC subunit